jgi:hypothetical protein
LSSIGCQLNDIEVLVDMPKNHAIHMPYFEFEFIAVRDLKATVLPAVCAVGASSLRFGQLKRPIQGFARR